MRPSKPRVVSVGNLADYPPELWGSRDVAKVAQHEREAARGSGFGSGPIAHGGPDVSGLNLYGRKRTPAAGSRSRAVDELLARLGVRSG